MESLTLLSSSIPSERVVSVLFLIFGIAVFVGPFCGSNSNAGPWVQGLVALFGLALFYAGIVIGNNCKRIDVFFDKDSGNLVFLRKGWFSARVNTESVPRSDVQKLEVETTKDSDGDSWFQLILKVKSGRQYLVSKRSMDKEEILRIREKYADILPDAAFGVAGNPYIPSTKVVTESKFFKSNDW